MMDPQKDVPKSIFSSGLITAGMYIFVMLAMLLLLSEKELGAATGIPAAVNLALTSAAGGAAKTLGYFLGIILILQYLSSASVWTLGAARVQAVAALDGSAPRLLGKFSKQGTPVAMCVLMGIVGSVMNVIIFVVTSGSLKAFIGVMIALDTSLTVVVYVFLIPAIIKLRTTHPHVNRPFIVPGGKVGLWVCAAITWVLSVITCITLLWPGLINSWFGQSYSMESSWSMSRTRFEIFTRPALTYCAARTAGSRCGSLSPRGSLNGSASRPRCEAPIAVVRRRRTRVVARRRSVRGRRRSARRPAASAESSRRCGNRA